MKKVLAAGLRWGVLPFVLFLGVVTGGVDGVVGWLVLAWMLWRGGPGMWVDVKAAVRWLSAGHIRAFFRRGRRSLGRQESLNV